MIFIDTHTHLNSEAFDVDRSSVIENAIGEGVSRFLIPSIDSASYKGMLDLESQYPNHVSLMMGLHPTHVNNDYQEELDFVKQKLSERPFIAVGEIGIDLYWDKTYLKEQQQAFDKQISWAKEYNLPINIHCRAAFDEVFEILEQHKSSDLRGVFHCFTGDLSQAKRAIDCGMHLGIGGVVTFKNGKIDRFLNEIPLENIVLETDAPYLAPVPFRGKRNESAHLVLVAERLSEIYGVSVEHVANITTDTVKKMFF